MSDSTFLPSRRDFLGKVGLASAAIALPGRVTAQEKPGGKLRVGIVGCGGRSNSVGDMALKDGRFEIVSLADYFQSQVDAQGEKFKVPANRRYTGLDFMFGWRSRLLWMHRARAARTEAWRCARPLGGDL